MNTTRRQFLATSAAVVISPSLQADGEKIPLVVVVTDPLSKELSCPCVEGYAQRDYAELGKFLSRKLGMPVQVHLAETLAGALAKKTAGKADIIIGKDSVIRAHAREQKLEVTKLAALTGKDGVTTQTGWLVVPSSDPCLNTEQLKGYRILFGPASAEEKSAAAKTLLKDLNVTYTSDDKDIAATCSVCATTLLEQAKSGEKVCGVISSYAVVLLEGCGTIRKGDLRVVGKTDPVPFISAFATGSISPDLQKKIQAALLETGRDGELCKVLETKHGFVDPDAKKK